MTITLEEIKKITEHDIDDYYGILGLTEEKEKPNYTYRDAYMEKINSFRDFAVTDENRALVNKANEMLGIAFEQIHFLKDKNPEIRRRLIEARRKEVGLLKNEKVALLEEAKKISEKRKEELPLYSSKFKKIKLAEFKKSLKKDDDTISEELDTIGKEFPGLVKKFSKESRVFQDKLKKWEKQTAELKLTGVKSGLKISPVELSSEEKKILYEPYNELEQYKNLAPKRIEGLKKLAQLRVQKKKLLLEAQKIDTAKKKALPPFEEFKNKKAEDFKKEYKGDDSKIFNYPDKVNEYYNDLVSEHLRWCNDFNAKLTKWKLEVANLDLKELELNEADLEDVELDYEERNILKESIFKSFEELKKYQKLISERIRELKSERIVASLKKIFFKGEYEIKVVDNVLQVKIKKNSDRIKVDQVFNEMRPKGTVHSYDPNTKTFSIILADKFDELNQNMDRYKGKLSKTEIEIKKARNRVLGKFKKDKMKDFEVVEEYEKSHLPTVQEFKDRTRGSHWYSKRPQKFKDIANQLEKVINHKGKTQFSRYIDLLKLSSMVDKTLDDPKLPKEREQSLYELQNNIIDRIEKYKINGIINARNNEEFEEFKKGYDVPEAGVTEIRYI